MSITTVVSTTGSANNGGTVTLTFTGVASSDYIIVSGTRGTSASGAMTVTSSSGGSYTNLLGATLVSSLCQFSVWGQLISSAGTPTQAIITGSGNSSDTTCAVGSVWRGVRSSAPTDVAVTSTTGNSSQPNSPSLTVNNSDGGDIIITAVGQQANATLTQPSSWTSLGVVTVNDTIDANGGQAWITYASTAAIDPAAWASTLAAGWGAATIALRQITVIFTWQNYKPQFPDYYRSNEIVGY